MAIPLPTADDVTFTKKPTIELDTNALNKALDAGNAASAAGLDNQAQAVEIIKAYLAHDPRLAKLDALEANGVGTWRGYDLAMSDLAEDWN